MKRIYRFMMAALAATAAMTACQRENLEPEVLDQEGVTVRVVASLSDETKASLADDDYLKWEVNDNLVARGYNAEGALIQIDGGKVLSIDEDANTAIYEFSGVPAGSKLWLGHNANNPTVKKFEFARFHNTFTQDTPGQINKENLMLVSEMISIPSDSETTVQVNTKMRIVGSILRFLVYSSTGVDEQLLSVRLEVADQNISGNNSGCLAYYFYADGTYKYWAENNENSLTDVPSIFYAKDYRYVQVNLNNSYSLSGVTEPAIGSGVYMPVAPLGGTGYKYIVTTDKNTYVFDASESAYSFKENSLKNVLLNLDKAELFVESGSLRYVGGITEPLELGADPTTDLDAGYWYAETQLDGETTWTKRVNAENAIFYENVKFSAVDAETGEPVSWVRAVYGGNEGCHWMVSTDENTGEARFAVLTATFSDVKGYVITDECKTKSITVSQTAAGSATEYKWGAVGNADLTFTSDAVTDWVAPNSYYCLSVGGQNIESWADDKNNEQALYATVTMTPYVLGTPVPGGEVASWVKVDYQKDSEGKYSGTHPVISLEENTSTAERKALVYINVTNEVPAGYVWKGNFYQFMITQAGKQIEVVAELSNVYAETVPAAGGEIAAAKLALTIDGEAAADVAAAMTQYGVTVAANNGASVSVAADGTVTMTVPENPYKNGGNTYTLTVKHDGKTLASAEINQAEGTEEGGNESGSEEGITYTIINNATDGSKGTGFGPASGSVGDWYRFEGITIDGKTYMPGQDMKDLVADQELVGRLMSQAFSFGEIIEDDVQIPGTDPLTTDPESFVTLEPWTDGGAAIYVRIILTANDTGARRTFKIITKDAEGVQKSSIVYFQNS